jgi:predicted metalloprotease
LYPYSAPLKFDPGVSATKAKEWQADCYAGAAMHWMSTGTAFPQLDYRGLLAQAADSGDSGVDTDSGYSHGIGLQRLNVWAEGWKANNPAACYQRTYRNADAP